MILATYETIILLNVQKRFTIKAAGKSYLYFGTFLIIFTATCLPVCLYRKDTHTHEAAYTPRWFTTQSIQTIQVWLPNLIALTTVGGWLPTNANFACTHSITVLTIRPCFPQNVVKLMYHYNQQTAFVGTGA